MRRSSAASFEKNWQIKLHRHRSGSVWHRGCTAVMLMAVWLMKFRYIRRTWHLLERIPPFLAVVFSSEGLGSKDGRTLVVGKFRRLFLSSIPPLGRYLQKRYKMTGGCTHCSSSCKLLFQCPHYDEENSRCSVYEDRPNICRMFPITPADIRDRDIVSSKTPCGFNFSKAPSPGRDAGMDPGKVRLAPVYPKSPKG